MRLRKFHPIETKDGDLWAGVNNECLRVYRYRWGNVRHNTWSACDAAFTENSPNECGGVRFGLSLISKYVAELASENS